MPKGKYTRRHCECMKCRNCTDRMRKAARRERARVGLPSMQGHPHYQQKIRFNEWSARRLQESIENVW